MWNSEAAQKMKLTLLLVCLLLLHANVIFSAPLLSYLVASFTSPDPSLPFNHIAVNNFTGDIFIGARERLYGLDSSLRTAQSVDVGKCPQGPGGEVRTNENQLLVVAPQDEKVITCGSCDRFCEIRSLKNISKLIRNEEQANAVVSTADAPAVGIVVWGSNAFYLFTGVSYAGGDIRNPISKFELCRLSFVQHVLYNTTKYPVFYEFVQIVHWGNYLYYVTQQIVQGGPTPTLGRLCPNPTDEHLPSYTEIQLQCVGQDSAYDIIRASRIGPGGSLLAESLGIDGDGGILYAVFTRQNSLSTESALCLYKMGDVQRRFEEAVVGCITGNVSLGMKNTYLRDSRCNVNPNIENPSNYQCFSSDLYRYAKGVVPLQANPILTWSDGMPSSLITAIERDTTVAIIGTDHGVLLKIHVVNSSSAYLYEKVPLNGGSVLRDMFLDASDEQLTVATSSDNAQIPSQVLSLSLANCSQYQSPEDCVGVDGGSDGDPFCGWCTLEGKCTRYLECRLRNVSSRWLSYDEQPIVISSISPTDRMPHGTGEQELTITIRQLPALIGDFQYKCAFDSYEEEETAIDNNTVSCKTPPASEVPPIPHDSDHISMTLSIISTETNKGIVSALIFFYRCSLIETCSSCVTSPWPCYWCVNSNRCTDDDNPCQDNVTIVAESNSRSSISTSVGQQYCPQLLNLTEEILIPVGISRGFNLTAANLLTSTSDTYECVIHIDGAEQRASASVMSSGSSVLCSSREYTYAGDIFEQRARVSVRRNTNIVIDDINRNHVTLYKCGVNGHSCSRCLSPAVSPVQFGCGWCQSACTVGDDPLCDGGFIHQGRANRCNSPVITDFWPRSGPFEGGTRVEINGTDLGVAFSNIINITAAMLPCSLLGTEEFYEPGMSVSCITTEGTAGRQGPLQMTVNGSRSTATTENFLYTDPVVSSFTPMEGPEAGGTAVTIVGAFLNSGRSLTARIGGVACTIRFVNESTAVCITERDNSDDGTSTEEPLTLTFDVLTERTSSLSFSFMVNPVITNLESIDRRSIVSGGVNLTIIGERFDLIQNPTAVVTYDGASNTEMCSGNDTLLRCPTPRLPSLHSRRRRLVSDAPVAADLEFHLDGLVIVAGTIDYYPDPVYFNFSGPSMIEDVVPGFPLTLQGANLDLVAAAEDIQVSVGANGDCAVFALNRTSIRCLLPDDQPGAGDYTGSATAGPSRNLPAVVILYGNLEFRPGWIRYTYSSFPQHVTVVVVVVVCVILIVGMAVAALFIYRRRRGDIDRIVRQLNEMELKIRDKADIVFQALQMDMSEIRAEVLHHKMPFVSTRDYLLNMMFAGLDHLPPTTEPNYVRESAEHAMLTFSNLLGEKAFLVQFIERLEGQNRQHSRARVNIASLITVILVTEGKLSYLTEVLLHLLRKEIEDASEKGRMRSLFKRTETIVEKLLSNWIALCMYSFLKQHAAQPLYLLYQAIQMQCEKGPVDAITGQAYFSLNFDFILDRDVQCQEVALAIVGEDNCVTSYVTVLDVDCITQAKQKILDAEYRKQHFVQQSRAHEVDLVWYLENGESRMLRDIDDPPEGTTLLQISTIKSYGLHDDCRVGLVQKVDTEANEGDPVKYEPYVPGKETYHVYENYAPMDSRNRDYSQMHMASSGLTLWHLVQEDALNSAAFDERGSTFHLQAQLNKNLSAPQLLIMKSTIDRFLGDFLEVVFQEPQQTPVTIKHLFDFFDSMAQEYGEDDHREIADSWKSDSLPHHFWVTTLSHPSYVFDMRQSRSADQCVSVITNVLDNACKKIIPEKKEDPSLNRVVYLRDLPRYIRMVSAFYDDVANQPPVDERTLQAEFNKIATEFSGLCSRVAALDQLYHCTKLNLQDMLKPVTDVLEGHGTMKN